jgi:hypothetical protein
MVDKVIRDGRVAVVYSHGYGSGWSTWCSASKEIIERLMFDPELVALVEKFESLTEENNYLVVDEIEKWVNAHFNKLDNGNDHVYCGSNIGDLTIEWVPVGTQFKISEYDGSESVHFYNPESWYIA